MRWFSFDSIQSNEFRVFFRKSSIVCWFRWYGTRYVVARADCEADVYIYMPKLTLMYIYAETDADTHADVNTQAEADVDAEANVEYSTDASTLHANFSEYSSYILCTFVNTFSSIHFGTWERVQRFGCYKHALDKWLEGRKPAKLKETRKISLKAKLICRMNW